MSGARKRQRCAHALALAGSRILRCASPRFMCLFGAKTNCDDHCTVVVAIVFAPRMHVVLAMLMRMVLMMIMTFSTDAHATRQQSLPSQRRLAEEEREHIPPVREPMV